MAENAKRNEPARSSEISLREWLLERTGTLIAGYLSALAVLAYPAGLVTLWVQLTGYYGFDHWTALYAASLVPVTLVVGKIATILFFSLLTNSAVYGWCIHVWGYKSAHRGLYNVPGNPLGLEDPDKPKGGHTTTIGQMVFSQQRTAIIGLTLVLPIIIFPLFVPTSLFNLSVYAAYLVLVIVGSYTTTPLVVRAAEENSRPKLYKAMVLAYAASIVAAVPLVGLGSPALPTVEMTWNGQKQEVSRLSHTAGYWHVIDQNKTIIDIPNDDVKGTVKVTGVVEKPGY